LVRDGLHPIVHIRPVDQTGQILRDFRREIEMPAERKNQGECGLRGIHCLVFWRVQEPKDTRSSQFQDDDVAKTR
jgi:hypothetical protein